MKKYILSRMGFIFIAFTTLTITGCGKNVVGPTTPDIQNQSVQVISQEQVAVNSTTAAEEQVSADCHVYQHTKGKKNQTDAYLKFAQFYFGYIHGFFTQCIAHLIVDRWFGDAGLTTTVKGILRSPLYNLVMLRCGVAQMLLIRTMKILTHTWTPGLNTNPQNCNPEISLMPYHWSLNSGFYGERIPGWGNGNGYHLESFTPDNDIVFVQTKSLPVNVFMNEGPINQMWWIYNYSPNTYEAGVDVPAYLRVSVANYSFEKRFEIYDLILEEDGSRIIDQEIWFSTENKSARCRIISTQCDWLNIDLTFDETGAGGGAVKVQNWAGVIDNYEFTVKANGHGTYKKNGGRTIHF